MHELRVAWGYARRVRVVRGRVAHPGRAPAAVAYRPEAAPRSHLGRSVRVALGSSFPEARAECPEAHTSKKLPHRRRRRDIARATSSRRTRVSRGDVSPPGCRETKLAKLETRRRGTTNHEPSSHSRARRRRLRFPRKPWPPTPSSSTSARSPTRWSRRCTRTSPGSSGSRAKPAARSFGFGALPPKPWGSSRNASKVRDARADVSSRTLSLIPNVKAFDAPARPRLLRASARRALASRYARGPRETRKRTSSFL